MKRAYIYTHILYYSIYISIYTYIYIYIYVSYIYKYIYIYFKLYISPAWSLSQKQKEKKKSGKGKKGKIRTNVEQIEAMVAFVNRCREHSYSPDQERKIHGGKIAIKNGRR